MVKTHPAEILLAGTPETSVAIAQQFFKSPSCKVVGVLCPNPKPVGRKQILTPCPLEQWATSHQIPVIHVEKGVFSSPSFYAKLPTCDLLIVADFGFLIPQLLLDWPKYGAYNLHPSLLPRWRGASPVPFTLLFGDTHSGISVIRMNAKFDQGAILFSIPSPVDPQESADELLLRLFTLGAEALEKRIPELLNAFVPTSPQPVDSPTPMTRKFTRKDGYLPFLTVRAAILGQLIPDTPEYRVGLLHRYTLPLSAESIHRMIRALQPWPGTWTMLPNGKRLKIIQTELSKNQPQTLRLVHVQLEGKNPTPFLITRFPEFAE